MENERDWASEKAEVENLQISVLSLWTKPSGVGMKDGRNRQEGGKCDRGELKE